MSAAMLQPKPVQTSDSRAEASETPGYQSGSFNSAELWAPIHGYAGKYEVSSFGRIRRLPSRRLLRAFIAVKSSGVYGVDLSLNGVASRCLVHHLVAEAFLGDAPRGHVLSFRSDDVKDCRIENLEWRTAREAHARWFRRAAVVARAEDGRFARMAEALSSCEASAAHDSETNPWR